MSRACAMFFLSAVRLCLSDSISNLYDSFSVCHADASRGDGDHSCAKYVSRHSQGPEGQTDHTENHTSELDAVEIIWPRWIGATTSFPKGIGRSGRMWLKPKDVTI